jgi:hypothetical protein
MVWGLVCVEAGCHAAGERVGVCSSAPALVQERLTERSGCGGCSGRRWVTDKRQGEIASCRNGNAGRRPIGVVAPSQSIPTRPPSHRSSAPRCAQTPRRSPPPALAAIGTVVLPPRRHPKPRPSHSSLKRGMRPSCGNSDNAAFSAAVRRAQIILSHATTEPRSSTPR